MLAGLNRPHFPSSVTDAELDDTGFAIDGPRIVLLLCFPLTILFVIMQLPQDDSLDIYRSRLQVAFYALSLLSLTPCLVWNVNAPLFVV